MRIREAALSALGRHRRGAAGRLGRGTPGNDELHRSPRVDGLNGSRQRSPPVGRPSSRLPRRLGEELALPGSGLDTHAVPEHPPRRIDVRDDLVIRWADLDDAEVIAAVVGESLEHLGPWMSWATGDAADLVEQRKRRVEMAEQTAAGTDYMYLVLAGVGGSMLGACGLHRRIGPGAVEIGYWLHPDHVGHGYITGAAAALTQAALDLTDVTRVEIHCDEANVRSQAVARRLGFRLDRIEVDGIQAPAEVGRSMVWIYPGSSS